MNLNNEYLEKVLALWEPGQYRFLEYRENNKLYKLINYSKTGDNEGLYTFELRVEDNDHGYIYGEWSFCKVLHIKEDGEEPVKIAQYAFNVYNRYVCGLFLYGKELYAVVTTGYCVYNEKKVVRKVWPNDGHTFYLGSSEEDDIPIFDKKLYRIDAESGALFMADGHMYYVWNQEKKEWIHEWEIPCSNGFISDVFTDEKPFYHCSKETAELIMEKGYGARDIPGYSDLPHTEGWTKT